MAPEEGTARACGRGAYLYWLGRVASPSCWGEGRHWALTSPEMLTHLPLMLCSVGQPGLLTLGHCLSCTSLSPPTKLQALTHRPHSPQPSNHALLLQAVLGSALSLKFLC